MASILLSCASDAVPSHYLRALRKGGWTSSIVAARARFGATRHDVAGLLLTGGADVDPSMWSTPAVRHRRTRPDSSRDARELPLVQWAWRHAIPILGICRGAQVVNVARGGDLVQDIPEASGCASEIHAHGHADEADLHHVVALDAASRLATIGGATVMAVNSRHHQAVRRLGDGLVAVGSHPATATADGLLVEAIEAVDPHRWVVGVQWHPENLVDAPGRSGAASRNLFAAFVDAARRRAWPSVEASSSRLATPWADSTVWATVA